MKTDAQLQRDVQHELGWDPAVKSTDIGVIVKDGVVTLTGDLTSMRRSTLSNTPCNGCTA